MPKSLVHCLSSDYLSASRLLYPRSRPRRIVAYVESYNDISFWQGILSEFETPSLRFQVMLPITEHLTRGKKTVLSTTLSSDQLGRSLLACVDSDYDFLMQGATETSRTMLENPYVLQTYTYAIENFQCYAPCLRQAVVAATLNDEDLFDFESFLARYSALCYPLFLWNVYLYRLHDLRTFPMNEFNRLVILRDFSVQDPSRSLERLRVKVQARLGELERDFPSDVPKVRQMGLALRALGLREETAYLYMQGHNVMDNVVLKMLGPVCQELRRRTETDIRAHTASREQKENELTGYQHCNLPVEVILRKSQAYKGLFMYEWIREDIRNILGPDQK